MIDLLQLHTTPMGENRIRQNLNLNSDLDAVEFCKTIITDPDSKTYRKGKNYYVHLNDIQITINCSSNTIITAHKYKNKEGN